MDAAAAVDWAKGAARAIIERHGEAAAIDTADYRECGFIIAAAALALSDAAVAERIGKLMEKPR